jgi:hypothetical protein
MSNFCSILWNAGVDLEELEALERVEKSGHPSTWVQREVNISGLQDPMSRKIERKISNVI